jgi:hypothetical protein
MRARIGGTLTVILTAALTSEAMLWMHIVLSVIAFDAYARRSWKLIAFVVASHLVFSFSVRCCKTALSFRQPSPLMIVSV